MCINLASYKMRMYYNYDNYGKSTERSETPNKANLLM